MPSSLFNRFKTKPAPEKESQEPDHMPGPISADAKRKYFERGSDAALSAYAWQITALTSVFSLLICVLAMIYFASRTEVHVFQVEKGTGGQLFVTGAATQFNPDEDTKMAWTSTWLSEMVEISPSLWRRNVNRAQGKTSGTAVDQLRAFYQREQNNPPTLLARQPAYVREYERRSVNKIAENTFMVRYETISRPAPGAQPERASFAATITIANVGHRTRDDVFRNPEGLVVTGFSISEESASR